MRARNTILALVAATWTATAAAADPPPVRSAPPGPDVILVTLDTTRRDRLGLYGHQGNLTPNLDGLARRAAVFDNAITPAPLTLPAHASLFTGDYPWHHRARLNGTHRLRPDMETVAEQFHKAGYRTAAVVASFVLARRTGLDKGFEHYDDDFRTYKGLERPAEAVTAAARDWLRGLEAHEACFLWVHYFDPHAPYDPPDAGLMAAGGDAYNGEIAWMDRQLGRLVYHVRKLGRLQRTIWVVVADHGEALGDHGEATHGKLLHDVTVRVPFFISVPGQRRQSRYAEQVSLLDVAPTLCELGGLPIPGLMHGQSLMPLLEGKPWSEHAVMLEAPRPRGEAGRGLMGIRTSRFKIVGNARTVTGFDLVADPDELHPVALQGTTAAELRKNLDLLLDLGRLPGEESLSPVGPGDRVKLQALGYLD